MSFGCSTYLTSLLDHGSYTATYELGTCPCVTAWTNAPACYYSTYTVLDARSGFHPSLPFWLLGIYPFGPLQQFIVYPRLTDEASPLVYRLTSINIGL